MSESILVLYTHVSTSIYQYGNRMLYFWSLSSIRANDTVCQVELPTWIHVIRVQHKVHRPGALAPPMT